MNLPPDDPRHGKTSTYTKLGCRCDDCREANTLYHARYMATHPEQVASHRQRATRRNYMKSKSTRTQGES